MKVLVACEESQRVCTAFRERGHEAFSCDIQECSGGHPEWHIRGDCVPIINGNCDFTTEDGMNHSIKRKWDLLIAHPPCTYLTCYGNRHFSSKMNTKDKIQDRINARNEAYKFFMLFINADCDRICVENPVGYCNSNYRKPDQIIHPYYFANSENDIDNYKQKRTCLWLKGLEPLVRTSYLKKPDCLYVIGEGNKCAGKKIGFVEGISGFSKEERQKERSKTFPGIAKAMAEQWGVYK